MLCLLGYVYIADIRVLRKNKYKTNNDLPKKIQSKLNDFYSAIFIIRFLFLLYKPYEYEGSHTLP